MSAPLEEYAAPLVTPTPLQLPALERRKTAAVDKLNSFANRIDLMESSDPRIQDIQRSAQLAVFQAETMQTCNFSPYEICKHAEDSTAKLEARITEYEKSKAEYGQKSMDYSRVSDQFQTKLGNAKINSVPLDFSRGAGRSYAPWDGPGINETQLIFPPKKQIVACVREGSRATKKDNPYLNDEKVVDKVAGSIECKKMVGLDFKDKALRKVGELRDNGELKVPPSIENPGHLAHMYEVFANCASNEQKSSQGNNRPNQKPAATQSPAQEGGHPKVGTSRDMARAMMYGIY